MSKLLYVLGGLLLAATGIHQGNGFVVLAATCFLIGTLADNRMD